MAFACTPPTGVAAQVVLLVAGEEEREGDGRKRLVGPERGRRLQGEVATVVVVRRGRADRRRGGRRRGGDEQQQREAAHRPAFGRAARGAATSDSNPRALPRRAAPARPSCSSSGSARPGRSNTSSASRPTCAGRRGSSPSTRRTSWPRRRWRRRGAGS